MLTPRFAQCLSVARSDAPASLCAGRSLIRMPTRCRAFSAFWPVGAFWPLGAFWLVGAFSALRPLGLGPLGTTGATFTRLLSFGARLLALGCPIDRSSERRSRRGARQKN